jgi:hypothetical protein
LPTCLLRRSCVTYLLVLPLLGALSLLGCLVWLLLLPLRFCACCCPLACVGQLLWDVVEHLVKAPLRGLLWATGGGWQAPQRPARGDLEQGRA